MKDVVDAARVYGDHCKLFHHARFEAEQYRKFLK